MTEIHLICPDCGGAIQHQCPPQSSRNPDATPEIAIAHVSDSRSKLAPKKGPYNQGYDQGFLVFWNDYPLHRDKRKAQIAWRKAIARANATVILDGAIRYRNDPNRIDQYTKYAEGWLNGDGWEDEPLPSRNDRPYDNAQAIYDEAQGGTNGQRPSPDHRGLGASLLPGPEAP